MTNRNLLIGVAVVIIAVVVAVVFVQRNQQEPETTTVGGREVVTYSTDTPSEVKPTKNDYAWKGKAGDPKYISLPTIKAEGHVQAVGTDQHGAVAVPNNVHVGGWFVQSAQPGKKGLSIIDGHVDGREDVGIFKQLGKLRDGAVFTVTLGDNSELRYKVLGKTTVKTADAPAVLFSQEPTVPSQLNLITCVGTFDRQSRSYDRRIIVRAVPE